MMGNTNPENLGITANIHNKELTILIDGGKRHNFLQDRLVRFLGLQVSQLKPSNAIVRMETI